MNITIPTIAVVSATLALAPIAHADQNDIDYLQELNMLGMNPATLHEPNLASEIALGHRIGLDLGPAGGGASPNERVTNMGRSLPNLSTEQIQSPISVAVNSYCGDVASKHQLPWVCADLPQSPGC
ncbi:DUF732 domain-containing protein [Mycobacterium sp. 663a-19]|uniref:DUF732 domain-containing protein n=1 Tax=Mycobacterium sp. 663a-19 TaxID=2986148 RepID=UPI002D1F514D|nr:DUF732 domain-containing protein [Mycobacterium sp. 663a-19]MEB3981889.1 DUF732 domain-containing protein [Mycobacterium sp. 663a-19]